MFQGKVSEFRIGVFGLEGHGKSGLIQRICANQFSDTPHTETEQQSTALWDNSFAYFWEFPSDQVTTEFINKSVIGFGAVVYVFDSTKVDADNVEKNKRFLETIMNSEEMSEMSFLLVGTKVDLLDPIQFSEIKPNKLMNTLTENIRKTQMIFFSAKDGKGTKEIQQWIIQRCAPVHLCEFGKTQAFSTNTRSVKFANARMSSSKF